MNQETEKKRNGYIMRAKNLIKSYNIVSVYLRVLP